MISASVVLPLPGGPHKIIDGTASRSIAARSARPGPNNSRCPTNSSSVRGRIRAANGVVSAGKSKSTSAPPLRWARYLERLGRRQFPVELAGKLHGDITFGVSGPARGIVEHSAGAHLSRSRNDMYGALQEQGVRL